MLQLSRKSGPLPPPLSGPVATNENPPARVGAGGQVCLRGRKRCTHCAFISSST